MVIPNKGNQIKSLSITKIKLNNYIIKLDSLKPNESPKIRNHMNKKA